MRRRLLFQRAGSRRGTAFTLIELLIVVAIIAILAAIAVPNFLEAQVRSKVARAKSDMRSIALAMEAYCVDNNGYFLNEKKIYTNLTTPIAYMATMPNDPFPAAWYQGEPRFDEIFYEAAVATAGDTTADANDHYNIRKGNTYMFESHGPSKTDDTEGDLSTGSFPWHTFTDEAKLLGTIYDPTNGTKSRGEIFRTGGMVPGPSKAHQTWFNATKN